MPISELGGGGGGGNGGAPSGGGGGGPHSHDFDFEKQLLSDVETWTRDDVFASERLYQTGIEVDQTRDFINIGLVINDDDVPRQLVYYRVRVAEWASLPVDTIADNGVFLENDANSGVLVFPTDDRFNIISFHMRRYEDANDVSRLSVGVFINASDTPSGDIIGINYFYEDKTVSVSGETDEASGGGGGGGGGGSYLSPGTLPDPLTADHVRRLYWDGGHLVIIRERHRDGTLTITWTDHLPVSTPSSSDVGELWGLAADAYRFRGIAVRGNQINGPTDDDVYVNPGGGWFRYNSTSGGAIGWVHLNPPNGWQEVVADRAEAEELVTDDDQVFAWGNGLHVSSDYARADAIASIQAEAYDVNDGIGSIAEFWGHGQTEAFPATAVARTETAGTFLRYRFAQEEPSTIIGHDFGVRAIDADEITGANLMTGETALLDQQILCFPPGTYKISFYAAHINDVDVTFGAWLYRILPGADALKLYYGSGYTSDQVAPLAGTATRYGQAIEFERIFVFTELAYLTIIAGAFGTASDAVNGVHDVIVEKLD